MTDDVVLADEEPSSAAARLAHEIRQRRETASLSQAKLAGMIGYSPQYVSLAAAQRHR